MKNKKRIEKLESSIDDFSCRTVWIEPTNGTDQEKAKFNKALEICKKEIKQAGKNYRLIILPDNGRNQVEASFTSSQISTSKTDEIL